jgi:cytochrome c-type biogenesis protein CcmH/NrfG
MARPAQLPTDVNGDPSWFDQFATVASDWVSRAWFFALCVLLVLVWAPSYFAFRDIDTWQLIINTATTIITFLLVALLQNTQRRADAAVQRKLNALALGLRDVLGAISDPQIAANPDTRAQLAAAVGLESRESS